MDGTGAVDGLENQKEDLEDDPLKNGEPVEGVKDRGDVLRSAGAG